MNLTAPTDYDLRNLVTHLVALGHRSVADAVLARLDVLIDHAVRVDIDSLLADFAAGPDADRTAAATAVALRDAAHVLRDDPHQLPGQLLAHLDVARLPPGPVSSPTSTRCPGCARYGPGPWPHRPRWCRRSRRGAGSSTRSR